MYLENRDGPYQNLQLNFTNKFQGEKQIYTLGRRIYKIITCLP